MSKTLKDWADIATSVQNACNLSGVVHSLSELMTWLRETYPGKGTDWYNQHPLVILFVSKLEALSGSGSYKSFHNGYEWALKVVRGETPDY